MLTKYPPSSGSVSKSDTRANSVLGSTPTATTTWSILICLPPESPNVTSLPLSRLIDTIFAEGIT